MYPACTSIRVLSANAHSRFEREGTEKGECKAQCDYLFFNELFVCVERVCVCVFSFRCCTHAALVCICMCAQLPCCMCESKWIYLGFVLAAVFSSPTAEELLSENVFFCY